MVLYSIILFCIVLHCIALHYIVLYYIALLTEVHSPVLHIPQGRNEHASLSVGRAV